jgi:uncharacterized protein YjbI with pentapeptide repeats
MKRTIVRSTIAVSLLTCTPLLAHAKCSDPPAPKVDWHGCDKAGRNLTKANLSGADLSGANLHDTTLRDADLHDAYLQGANLTDANLNGANLGGADLSGATWIDGKTKCAAGSIGACK